MSEVVFILGAGASKHCRIPLMNEFISVARNLLKRGEIKEAGNAFSHVIDAVGKLNAVHSKASLDTTNIESVYTAFEMGRLLGKLPGIEDEERIESLIPAIKKVIGYTLEKTTRLTEDVNLTFPAYHDFTNILKRLIELGRSFSIITFNYDIGLDYSLYRNRLVPDYCLGDLEIRGKFVTYLKLHGSLNFGKCSNPLCRRLVPYRNFQYTETTAGADYSTIPIINKLKRQKCLSCGEPLEEDPVLIPPTWNKTSYHEQIEQVWRRAAKDMGDAEYIFVLGYSLPDTDWFFNYLYGLGVEMETSLEGFYVYNPDPSVKTRFEKLIGYSVKQKYQFKSLPFEQAIENANLYIYSPLGIR